MSTQPIPAPAAPAGWIHRLGIALFVYSFIPLLTVELITLLDVSTSVAVTLGAIFLASGELAFLAAVAVLGKPFVTAIKDTIKNFLFKPKSQAQPKVISRPRHALGVILFVLSIVPYYATIGVMLLGAPKEADLQTLLRLLLIGEALFFVSLFVLGEEFWARLKRLFEWPGKELPG